MECGGAREGERLTEDVTNLLRPIAQRKSRNNLFVKDMVPYTAAQLRALHQMRTFPTRRIHCVTRRIHPTACWPFQQRFSDSIVTPPTAFTESSPYFAIPFAFVAAALPPTTTTVSPTYFHTALDRLNRKGHTRGELLTD